MKRSLREVLAESHVAAAIIATLLLWSMDGAFRALWPYISGLAVFVATAVAILDIPYISPGLGLEDRFNLITTFYYLFPVVIELSATWLLSRWIYGVGPLRCLAQYHRILTGRKNA